MAIPQESQGLLLRLTQPIVYSAEIIWPMMRKKSLNILRSCSIVQQDSIDAMDIAVQEEITKPLLKCLMVHPEFALAIMTTDILLVFVHVLNMRNAGSICLISLLKNGLDYEHSYLLWDYHSNCYDPHRLGNIYQQTQ